MNPEALPPFKPGDYLTEDKMNALRDGVMRNHAKIVGLGGAGSQATGFGPLVNYAELRIKCDGYVPQFGIAGAKNTSVNNTGSDPRAESLLHEAAPTLYTLPGGGRDNLTVNAAALTTPVYLCAVKDTEEPAVGEPCGMTSTGELSRNYCGLIAVTDYFEWTGGIKVCWVTRPTVPLTMKVELSGDVDMFSGSEPITSTTGKVKYRDSSGNLQDAPNPDTGSAPWTVKVYGDGVGRKTGDIVTVAEVLGFGLQIVGGGSPLKIGSVDADIAPGTDGTITLITESGTAGTLDVHNPHEVTFEQDLIVMAFDVLGWPLPLVGVFEWSDCAELDPIFSPEDI